jgi:DNA-binding LacI/PurR family transcriptional regulator
MPGVTLKDVAARAGVSYQTVSKVINNQVSVSPDTAARIWEAVHELKYRPNVSARNLRMRSSNLIGYAWRQSADYTPHPILDQFLYSAAATAEEHGYHLMSFLIGDDNALDGNLYHELYLRRQVEGFLLADTNHNDPRIDFLRQMEIPFASFGRANDDWEFCWVDVDGRAGMAKVTAHLLAKGHKRIGLLTWPQGSMAGEEREQGYQACLEEAGIELNPIWIIRCNNSVGEGVRGIKQLLNLAEAERPSAVICVSDTIAIGAVNGAAATGLIVGEDIAVTGFDDLPLAEYLHPPLTSVRQPIPEVGRLIVELLVKQINGEPIVEKGILLEPELIIRDSSNKRHHLEEKR